MHTLIRITLLGSIFCLIAVPMPPTRAASMVPDVQVETQSFMTPVSSVTQTPMSYAYFSPAAISKVSVQLPQVIPTEIPCPSDTCMGRTHTVERLLIALPSALGREFGSRTIIAALAIAAISLAIALELEKKNSSLFLARKLSTVVLRV
jgi:hypothetical protein